MVTSIQVIGQMWFVMQELWLLVLSRDFNNAKLPSMQRVELPVWSLGKYITVVPRLRTKMSASYGLVYTLQGVWN